MRIPDDRKGDQEMVSTRHFPSLTLPLNRKPLYLLLFSFTVLTIGGCGFLSTTPIGRIRATPIGAIVENPKVGRRVYLQGTIAQQVPFLGSGAYQLQDDTGRILVITTRSQPETGEEVLIKGTIQYQSFSIDDREFGEVYIEETKQLDLQELSEP